MMIDWDAVLGITTGGLALATFALAVVAWKQAKAAGDAAVAAREQAEAAHDAVEAAMRSVDQAWRTRVDEASPYVVAYTDKVQWPPVLRSNAFGEDTPFEVLDRVMVSTKEPGRQLFLDMTGRLVNEGRVSALVLLAHDMTPLDDGKTRITDDRGRILLRPGAELQFSFRLQKTLEEWVEQYSAEQESPLNEHGHRHGTKFGHLIIYTGYDEGVTDYVFMQAWAMPIQPVHNDPGRWVRATGDEPKATMGLSPTRRRYYYSKIDNDPASDPPRAPWQVEE